MTTLTERFWAKVSKTGSADCWLWTAAVDIDGYGRFTTGLQPRVSQAHRFAYELLVGPIPAGLTIDHLCRVRACVNPSHLEPVTDRENRRRGNGVDVRNAKVTHCPQGHPYDEANTSWERKKHGMGRKCRTCANAARARRRLVGK